MTPRRSVELEIQRRGRDRVVSGARALVRGDEVDPQLVLALGGPPARKLLDGDVHLDDYWLRVWGARGLLWAWDDDALPEIRIALSDPAWRVREMALKVVARHGLDELVGLVAGLTQDPVVRVQQQAHRCLQLIGSAR